VTGFYLLFKSVLKTCGFSSPAQHMALGPHVAYESFSQL